MRRKLTPAEYEKLMKESVVDKEHEAFVLELGQKLDQGFGETKKYIQETPKVTELDIHDFLWEYLLENGTKHKFVSVGSGPHSKDFIPIPTKERNIAYVLAISCDHSRPPKIEYKKG